MRTRRRHAGQRGQSVAIIALSATVLVGVTALAVDLSVQTHYRRNLQNVTDAATLAGVRDLSTTASQSQRITAATDALKTVHTVMQWPTFSVNWISQSLAQGGTCNAGGSTCDVDVTPPSPYDNFDVQIHVPPKLTTNAAYKGQWGYVEVQLTEKTTNGFAGVIGLGKSTEGGRSVAYHNGPAQPFGFALYAKSVVASGNDGEHVVGNVYAGRNINPQSGGHAGFCTDNGGYVIFGSPQKGDSGYTGDGQYDILPKSADVVQTQSSCASSTSGTVNQTTTTPTTCNGQIVSGLTISGGYNSFIDACVANPPIDAPTLNSPPYSSSTQAQMQAGGTPYCLTSGKSSGKYQPGYYACSSGTSLSVDAPLAPGVYVIDHLAGNNCKAKSCFDLDFSGVSSTLQGVTFVLLDGASLGVEKNAQVSIDPFTGCNPIPGDTDDCFYPIYASAGSASEIDVVDTGTTLTLYGTFYAPGAAVNVDSNAYIDIAAGQAIVSDWNVQSGFHTNPDITYSNNLAAPQTEILKLVE